MPALSPRMLLSPRNSINLAYSVLVRPLHSSHRLLADSSTKPETSPAAPVKSYKPPPPPAGPPTTQQTEKLSFLPFIFLFGAGSVWFGYLVNQRDKKGSAPRSKTGQTEAGELPFKRKGRSSEQQA